MATFNSSHDDILREALERCMEDELAQGEAAKQQLTLSESFDDVFTQKKHLMEKQKKRKKLFSYIGGVGTLSLVAAAACLLILFGDAFFGIVPMTPNGMSHDNYPLDANNKELSGQGQLPEQAQEKNEAVGAETGQYMDGTISGNEIQEAEPDSEEETRHPYYSADGLLSVSLVAGYSLENNSSEQQIVLEFTNHSDQSITLCYLNTAENTEECTEEVYIRLNPSESNLYSLTVSPSLVSEESIHLTITYTLASDEEIHSFDVTIQNIKDGTTTEVIWD